jgi:hypothetical protein
MKELVKSQQKFYKKIYKLVNLRVEFKGHGIKFYNFML